MIDHETAMLAYARLAAVSQEKHQLPGRDKLLVLVAAEACRAGWPEVAAAARGLIVAHNPSHLIGRYATVADALRSEDFSTLVRSLERLCNRERAEHLAARFQDDGSPADDSIGARALAMLGCFPNEPPT